MDIVISNSSDRSIYKQISSQIKGQILSGKLNEGRKLPSIRKLAKELQVSVITTKKAYEELRKEGLIETVSGKGTYIAAKNMELFKEKKMNIIEEKLFDIIKEAKSFGLELDQINELISILYEEA